MSEVVKQSSNPRASMESECQPIQKETTRKYRRISRLDQARMVQAVVQEGRTQESVAEQNNVPRSTLEHWIKRRQELGSQHDSEVGKSKSRTVTVWIQDETYLTRKCVHVQQVFHCEII